MKNPNDNVRLTLEILLLYYNEKLLIFIKYLIFNSLVDFNFN